MTKVAGIRLKPETLEKLNMLAQLNDMNRSEYVSSLVEAQYDHIMGDPKLKALMEQLKVLKRQLDELNGSNGILTAGVSSPVNESEQETLDLP